MSQATRSELPRSVDPYRLAAQHADLEGFVLLGNLPRFAELVREYNSESSCQVRLTFGMDEERRRVVTGALDVEVTLDCQRCMGPIKVPVSSVFALGLVTTDEQAQQLPKELEPFLTEEGSADLWQMIEDELLLVVPPFPLHDRSECPMGHVVDELAEEEEQESSEEQRPNPFSVLADLKTKKH